MRRFLARADFASIAFTLAEVAALVIDAFLAHQSLVLAMGSYTTSAMLAALSAILIFMAGEFAGAAAFRRDRVVMIGAAAVGVGVVCGIGVVRARYGLGGQTTTSGVAAALGQTSDDTGTVLIAVIVSIFMLGVLCLGAKASYDRTASKADRLASEIVAMGHEAFALEHERDHLEAAYRAAVRALHAGVEDLVARAAIAAVPQATDADEAIDLIEQFPFGEALAGSARAGGSAFSVRAGGAASSSDRGALGDGDADLMPASPARPAAPAASAYSARQTA